MDLKKFKSQLEKFALDSVKDGRFVINEQDSIPCLADDSEHHDGYCPIYLYHTSWAARILANTQPKEHVDIGGLIYFAGIISAIVPIKFYDIRKTYIPFSGITTGEANLTNLPFKSNSISSLSCMHVMEHIGLGRYGDGLDVGGDLKSAAELIRVLAPGGQLLMVLPVGRPKVVFNAHRIYSYEQVIDMFSSLYLKEFTLIDLPHILHHADPSRVSCLSEGAGCFHFVKCI